MATPTVYIVWDATNGKVMSGPFGTSGEATSSMRRVRTKNEGRKGLSHEGLRPYTVETLNG